MPVINLGFSGNGTLDPEMADLLGEIDAAVYVLDCLPNLGPQQVAERTEPFVKALRKARPDTPILMVEDRNYANAPWNAGSKQRNADNHAAFKKAYEALTAAGVKGLHYLPGDKLIGDDGEGTVDGSHPTDLGFVRQADALEAYLKPVLTAPRPKEGQVTIEGYADRLSYVAGEEVGLCVSTSAATFHLEVARVGAERTVVLRQKEAAGKWHPTPANASSHGCGWPAALKVKVPAS